jgi:ABC-2 type transport system ATP-binding protein
VLCQPHDWGCDMTPAVFAQGVHVRFGGLIALAGVDLEIDPGSTLAVLGHNGAGKTTLIRVLTTLIRPSSGRAFIDGLDVVDEADEVRRRIGVTGQYAGLDEFLTGRENLELVGRLSGLASTARDRAADLVARLDLGDIADRRVGALSGGSRRRIDLAASLVAAPSVLFLDEPTTGLDPVARAVLWDVVADLTDTGTTVVLTTQYLEEADRLADEVVVLDHGQVVAEGTPTDLKRLVGGKVVTATVQNEQLARLSLRPDETHPISEVASRITYSTDDGDGAALLVATLAADGVAVDDLDIGSPTLDDVFTHLMLQGARP